MHDNAALPTRVPGTLTVAVDIGAISRPEGLVLGYPNITAALSAVSTSICDAVVFDLPALIAAKRTTPDRYGAIAGRVGRPSTTAPCSAKGRRCDRRFNKAIASLRRQGVFRRLGAEHFGPALAATPVIR